MIEAPVAVVSLWESEAVRALAAADRATDRLTHLGPSYMSAEVRKLVAHLAGELTRAASVLRGSAIQATPEGAAVFLAGVDRLAREFDGDFACDRCVAGDHGQRIDIHTFGQRPCEHVGGFPCCAGDDGCEGGTA